ncbi:UNVERIFIED_CONTAM: putative mitochondrial protein [Sesamum radiatum]|uniref:Mitochondrial protein n=1 Tax=Sesamum radiatum TaxID=300843 RepID=A0AAW2M1V4_SESRA
MIELSKMSLQLKGRIHKRLVSLYAIKGDVTCKTLRVNGLVGDKEVLILINCGSTHYFVHEKVSGTLGCKLEETTPTIVRVADASKIGLMRIPKYLSYFSSVKYDDAFKEPSSLPPETKFEHGIELLPEGIPMKQNPYRYSYGQKTEIEIIVKEMLDNGIIKPSQSSFVSPILLVDYLRHIISWEGVSTDPQKIECMVNWTTPTTIKALRGFLGLTGYYRKFIRGNGAISKPLTSLLKKDALRWNSEANTMMVKEPVLALPEKIQMHVEERLE